MKIISLDKVFVTISSLFGLFVAIVVAKTAPAKGFELTIYNAYPAYFWIALICCNAFGLLTIFRGAFRKTNNNWAFVGLLEVIVSNSIFLALPYFRGYGFFPTGDAMSHIGMIKDIVATGHIGASNIYPILHLVGVNLFETANIKEAQLATLLIVLFNLIYLLNVYLLAKIISKNKNQTLLIIAFACPLVFSAFQVTIHPSMLSIYFIPLLLFLAQKYRQSSAYKTPVMITLVIITTMITFMHPVTCIFGIIALFTLGLASDLYQRWRAPNKEGIYFLSPNYTIALIMLTLFSLWYFSYSVIQGSFKNVYAFLANGQGTPLFEQQITSFSTSGLTISQAILLFLNKYGGILIVAIISTLSGLLILIKSITHKQNYYSIQFSYSIMFFVGIVATGFSLFGLTGEYEPLRVSRFFLVVAPYVFGLGVFEGIRLNKISSNKNKIFNTAIFLLIVPILATSVVSYFNVYGSPRTVESNWQVTEQEIDGTLWFGPHQDGTTLTADAGLQLKRFDDFDFGLNSNNNLKPKMDPNIVPSNFGYDENTTIADTFQHNARYLITCESARININVVPINDRPKAHNYGGPAFVELSSDHTIAKIYANPEIEIWRIN